MKIQISFPQMQRSYAMTKRWKNLQNAIEQFIYNNISIESNFIYNYCYKFNVISSIIYIIDNLLSRNVYNRQSVSINLYPRNVGVMIIILHDQTYSHCLSHAYYHCAFITQHYFCISSNIRSGINLALYYNVIKIPSPRKVRQWRWLKTR